MNTIQKIGLVLGFILFLGWFGILLHSITSFSQKSVLVDIFTRDNFAQYFSGFNCLGCVSFMLGVFNISFEIKCTFMVLSSTWLSMNIIFIVIIGITSFLTSKTNVTLRDYPYSAAILIIATVLHLILLVIAILIFNSLKQETRPPRKLYKPKVICSEQPSLITNKQNNVNKSNRKLRFVGRCNNRNYKNNMIDGDRLRNDSIIFIPGNSGPYSKQNYVPPDDREPISTSCRGQEMHHFGIDTHSDQHGHHLHNNDWHSTSHHSNSHDTHWSPTHSNSLHDMHTSLHDTYTTPHDTHTSSHDTHTSSNDTHDYGGCDSGGGGYNGGDCGGGDY